MPWKLLFSSLRGRLLLALGSVGLLAPLVTTWEATTWATQSLTDASYAKLSAVRETRRRQIEGWFADVATHVRVMSTNESLISALEQFSRSWPHLPEASSAQSQDLTDWYRAHAPNWLPADLRTQALQHHFILKSPPEGRDLQLAAEPFGDYGRAHETHHPSMRTYQNSFGFYDVLLVDESGNVVYTVKKETDLGAGLRKAPYSATGLARVFEKAMTAEPPHQTVIEDFSFYAASNAPAAFLAAPVWRAGSKIGALVIQVSIDEINRVMTGNHQWSADGLGQTGQAYIVGADGKFRSDLRAQLENQSEFIERLRQTHGDETARLVQLDHTEVLHAHVNSDTFASIQTGVTDTHVGVDFFGRKVLRSQAPMKVPGLDWWVIAEMEVKEAFGPVRTLQRRMMIWGALFSALLLAASLWLSNRVVVPLRALRDGVKNIGAHAFTTRVQVGARGELGELEQAFNEMAARLETTTVSKDSLQQLAAQLIEAQENERRTIARELHDDFGQRFAALSMDLSLLNRADAATNRPEVIARMRNELLSMSNDVRNLSRSLHPSTLDDLGLVAALESECRLINERGLPVEFYSNGSFDDLSKSTQATLYRIAQEALHNIVKHAQANVAIVRLDRDAHIRLSIVDDGKGFNAESAFTARKGRGLGLSSMQERARLLGGTLHIVSLPGQGTSVEVTLPLEAA